METQHTETYIGKHTEGQWSAAPNGMVYRRPYTELYEYGGGVAGDHPIAIVTKGHSSWENKFNQEANAHLIAAAPDMLRALQKIVDLNERALNTGNRSSVFPVFRAIDESKSAIAKATGQS